LAARLSAARRHVLMRSRVASESSLKASFHSWKSLTRSLATIVSASVSGKYCSTRSALPTSPPYWSSSPVFWARRSACSIRSTISAAVAVDRFQDSLELVASGNRRAERTGRDLCLLEVDHAHPVRIGIVVGEDRAVVVRAQVLDMIAAVNPPPREPSAGPAFGPAIAEVQARVEEPVIGLSNYGQRVQLP